MNSPDTRQQEPLPASSADTEAARPRRPVRRDTRPPYYVRQASEKRILRAQIHELGECLAHLTAQHDSRVGRRTSEAWRHITQTKLDEKRRALQENDRLRKRLQELSLTYRTLQQVFYKYFCNARWPLLLHFPVKLRRLWWSLQQVLHQPQSLGVLGKELSVGFAKTVVETRRIAHLNAPTGLVELTLTPCSFEFRYADSMLVPFGLQETFGAFKETIENHQDRVKQRAREVSAVRVRRWWSSRQAGSSQLLCFPGSVAFQL